MIRRKEWQLFAVSFVSLFLELMLIRWSPAVVRLIAYYANLLLISSFLGLGIGAMQGLRRKSLFGLFPPLLLLHVGVLLLCRQAILPGSGLELRFGGEEHARLLNYAVLVGVFLANAAVFVPLGQRIGSLFESLPALKAYAWDLSGSLCGAVCFGVFSWSHFSPLAGLALVSGVVLALSERKELRLRLPCFLAVLACVGLSSEQGAVWSPYYFVTVHEGNPGAKRLGGDNVLAELFFADSRPVSRPREGLRAMKDPPIYTARVNQFFYQPNLTLNPARYTDPAVSAFIEWLSHGYRLPFALSRAHERVLVLGAGGGTDVEAALASGAEQVDAVEIDPVLVGLSRKFNPSGVYDSPRVRVHVDDARAFLRKAAPGYDMVLFGLLDSQALFSQMSSIRLDGYVYTVESMRSAYALLAPEGLLSVSFMAGKDWVAAKLLRMLQEATGKTPLMYADLGQVVLCVSRGPAPEAPPSIGRFRRVRMESLPSLEAPSDDWPYLYLSGRRIPPDYLAVILTLLALSIAAVVLQRGRGFGAEDGKFLFLGMGFLLLETASISDCSLYLGTTWLVTTAVVSGVLLMCLAANLAAQKLRPPPWKMAVPLFATLLLLYAMPKDQVLSAPLWGRLLWTVLVVPLPVFFAGLLFSSSFRDAGSRSALFGANLIGAVIGGFCEYLGMAIGHRALLLIVMGAYAASLLAGSGPAGRQDFEHGR